MRTLWQSILSKTKKGEPVQDLLTQVDTAILTSSKIADIKFGTSGWRAVIGEDYTLGNVHRVTRAILSMYRNDVQRLSSELGVTSFEEFAHRGVIIGHDSRYMGDLLCQAVAKVFTAAEVRVGYADLATTPELSGALVQGGFACSINLTSSHNPGLYGGYKFNPSDGGPASVGITSTIEKRVAAEPMQAVEKPGNTAPRVDSLKLYMDFLESSPLLDLTYVREIAKSGEMALCVDHVGGATTGKVQYLLEHPKGLLALRREPDPLFGGGAPEPSAENMKELIATIDAQPQKFKLGAIMDPDGDRVRFYDGHTDISMNQFGAIAYHYLAKVRGFEGGVGKSVATSNLVNAIARGLGRPLFETAVGFKNFRPYLIPQATERALICFEESDGISGWGNTLEKDAFFGFLLGIEIQARTGKTLTQYLNELYQEFGMFYPLRFGFEVGPDLMGAGVVRIMEKLKSSYPAGANIATSSGTKTVAELLTLDGLKWVFADGSWMLIRPSGTEPKVRVYAEAQDEAQATELFEAAKKLFAAVS